MEAGPDLDPDVEAAAAEVMDGLFREAPVGLVVYDTGLRITRVNHEFLSMEGIPTERCVGMRVDEMFPPPDGERMRRELQTVLDTGSPTRWAEYRGHFRAGPGRDHVWSVSSFRLTTSGGRVAGVASAVVDVTVRHHARERLSVLNDATERIGSALDVRQTARELADVAVPRLADFIAVDLLDGIARGGSSPHGPIGSAAVLRRAALRSVTEHAPEATYPVGALMTFHPATPYAQCLTSGRPLLVPDLNRAADWLAQDPPRAGKIVAAGIHSLMTIPVKARNVTLGLAHFYRWRLPFPFDQEDLALAQDLVARAAVSIDNARRYTQEHRAALDLQHSLLLRSNVPDPSPIETAHRYLPARAHAGVGGDWFDVLPLSGARVGLVVGDVTGRGIQAVARAGLLRTAVRTLASLDLPPDELLFRLDALASRQAAADESAPELGGTCLYAIYDPVTGQCTMASAGHLPPALVRPGEGGSLVDLPVGPPLGLGSLPFAAIDTVVPDDSMLALCTNGLLQDRQSDLDDALDRMLHTLAAPTGSLDRLCGNAVDAALGSRRPDDDAVLLLARTRMLPASSVATWDLPADPAHVAHARALASGQLAAWGLDDAAPLTELVVSELVTNAVRYGQAPIRLRLVLARTLICEVSDSSSTSPHLRYAADTDEGGRGLFMVAQLADAWGTRYTARGKTIWAEQSIAASTTA
ncbi:SpoIIE family protein phosphatase [Streptomyces sp. NPDC056503]|uniref:SpoIIE family protein phosphatase n=1 Tax=Streptomyces sp. NPDC056503 TaxID=3345842 RepID=UPI0036976F7A